MRYLYALRLTSSQYNRVNPDLATVTVVISLSLNFVFMQHRTTKLQLLKDLEKSLKKPNDFHENRHRSLFSTPHRTLAVHGALAGAQ